MPNVSPNAYDVASVTALAPTIDASISRIEKTAPAAGPMRLLMPVRQAPCASVKWPAAGVPAKANAEATMIAVAPMTTTHAPITVSARS